MTAQEKIPTVEKWMAERESHIFECPNCYEETDFDIYWCPEEGEECTDENIQIECLSCGDTFGGEHGTCTREEAEEESHDIWKCEKCKQKYVKWWCSNWGEMEGNLCQKCFTEKTGRIPKDVSYCDKEGGDYWLSSSQIEDQPEVLREQARPIIRLKDEKLKKAVIVVVTEKIKKGDIPTAETHKI